MISGLFSPLNLEEVNAATQTKELRGLWISVFEFDRLGLNTTSEKKFRKNAQTLLYKAADNGINTIFFHVRAFDDAVFPSKNFKLSTYVSSGKSYDPLAVMVELAHANGMELHGWMNPYRITYNYFLDPAKTSSTNRIKLAVKEVMKHNVDGIHFDDYFYHAKLGYKNTSGTVTVKSRNLPSAKTKRQNVNAMVRSVRQYVHNIDNQAVFGISPQGNPGNCRASGADIDTWLSKSGYVDYLMPQLYWSNDHGSSSDPNMFTSRLKAYKSLNKKNLPLYAGLALYKTGKKQSGDPGWTRRSTNIKEQVEILRNNGYMGYSFFSAQDLSRSSAQKELKNYRTLLHVNKTAPAAPKLSSKHFNYNTIKLNWNAVSGASGYKIYRSNTRTGTFTLNKTIDGGKITTYSSTGLTTGKTYYYKIKAFKAITGRRYESGFSNLACRTPKPSRPLVSSSSSGRTITIKWSKVAGADGYSVYRSSSRNGPFQFQKRFVGATPRHYTNKNLKKGKTYYYKVKAYHTEKGKRIYGYNSTIVKRTIK